jgi:hypothetical protein
LAHYPGAERFGLELPMAVVRDAMWADKRLRDLLQSAAEIEFLWEMPMHSDDLISELGLHPWSLLPAGWHLKVTKVNCSENTVDIRAGLTDPRRPSVGRICAIRLGCEGTFRAMRVDKHLFRFQFEKGYLLVSASTPVNVPLSPDNETSKAAQVLLRIENPLQQHIVSILRRQPLVDIGQTIRSQRFLELVASLCG